AAKAIGDAFADVSKLMASIEQRDLKNYEKSQNKKKKSLDRQLKSGVISQDAYNSKVQALDEQTEAKRVELERKQAERQKALAIFNAIVSTAVAIVKAFEAGPIAGPILAGVIGALGAVQIATIIAQPLPGKEEGGWIDVVREQDGKPFRAKNDPTKRGAITSPTAIVSEAGTEYVVPADGYRNPTVRPVLDIIERARLSGELGSINLEAVMQANPVQGRVNGGLVTPTRNDDNSTSNQLIAPASIDGGIAKILTATQQSIDRLNERLNSPISAQVVMTGEKGLAKQYDKYNKLRNNATIGRR
ncbi:MAG: phage tail tape measure protein, partial [Mucinivorans sp.]